MGRCRSALGALLGLLLLPGCDTLARLTSQAAPSASASVEGPPQPVRPMPVANATLSTASAFELLASERGLTLVWAERERDAGWLRRVELGPLGEPLSSPQSIQLPARTLGKVADLAAIALDGQQVFAWLELGAGEARALSAWMPAEGGGSVFDLGPAGEVADAARGNLALAAEAHRGRALLLWRGRSAPCVDLRQSGCTGFAFRRLGPEGAKETGLPLSVPVPCASHAVALASVADRLFYGVCTREGSDAVTTMFSIQHAPEYARAEPLLRGCQPLGTLALEQRPWLVADCRGKRRAARVPLADEPVEEQDVDVPSISCTPQRAELSQGRFRLLLREPRAGIEMILPPRLLPTGARAAWSGAALVMAYPVGSRLEIRSLTCRDGKLVP